jgi:hypothetical protein
MDRRTFLALAGASVLGPRWAGETLAGSQASSQSGNAMDEPGAAAPTGWITSPTYKRHKTGAWHPEKPDGP